MHCSLEVSQQSQIPRLKVQLSNDPILHSAVHVDNDQGTDSSSTPKPANVFPVDARDTTLSARRQPRNTTFTG